MKYDFDIIITEIKGGKYNIIGTGSSRTVYDLNDGFAVKIARDIRGTLQNESERKAYQSHRSELLAEVVAVSEDNRCLVMPKAKRIKNLSVIYNYYNKRSIKSLFMHDKLIIGDIKNNGLSSKDLSRASNWGLIDNVPLIIDYGLTHSIYKRYYGPNKLFKRFKPIQYS
ncbi:hypothetical protein LY28_02700 [Ruminiclostridium sufflavum DSM 19573]|uniref:Serine/threonine protein kinase n=1 Tax=Ruminiclostridium sufflavum DSM 19573 TaxID=1121337 RepID=A0A318XVN4_9FIRM|nr:hypothetical protein [Ruminiclostridium sufflavum]PYG86877.1 hypothetical protein LY28_02700 [Ruminiclostridium sufflavum DSM 19573]